MAKDTLAIHSFSDIESIYEKYLQGLRILKEGAKAETGQTPKEVIWTKNKARLYHYEPLREKRFPVPILLIYALINRSYVLDLMPGASRSAIPERKYPVAISLGLDAHVW